jgi:SP family xylose:H+ symportor-like MFS transporter
MYYAPEIFKQVGSGTSAALLQTVIIGLFNVSFTLVAMRTVDRVGRKKLMMIGIAGMGVSLLAISLAALWNKTELWLLVFILGYIASFAMSIGPIVWVVMSEIFPTRIRGRAMAISTVSLWAADYLVSLTFPIINENTWLVEHFNHAFPFWIYASLCVVMFLFVWRSVPETKGKTLEEIEKLWMAK